MPITPPQYDPNARAQNAAQTKYGAAESQINRAIEQARMQEVAQKAALDQYGAAGRQVIGDTYQQLGTNLEANRANTANELGTQVGLVGQGYRDAGALAEQARADSAARMARLAGTIHLSGAGQADASTGMEQLASRILGNNAMDDATRTGNLRTWSAQQDAFLRQGMAQGEREGAQRKSSFENELVRALSELQADYRNQEFQNQGSLLDLLNERGSFTVGAANDYTDQQFAQMLQAGQFNLSEQEAQAQAAARAAAQSLAERQYALQERSYEEGKGRDSLQDFLALSGNARAEKAGALDNLLKQQQLNKMPEARTIDEWAAQQGIPIASIDSLMQEYQKVADDIRRVSALQETGGDLTARQRYEINTYGQDPITELLRRNPQGMYDSTGRTQKLTSTQVRDAMSYLGRG